MKKIFSIVCLFFVFSFVVAAPIGLQNKEEKAINKEKFTTTDVVEMQSVAFENTFDDVFQKTETFSFVKEDLKVNYLFIEPLNFEDIDVGRRMCNFNIKYNYFITPQKHSILLPNL